MVAELGMSDLGPTVFAPRAQFGIWPVMAPDQTQVSPDLAAKIDREIAKIIDEGYKIARQLLQKHRAQLDKVADALLDRETLERGDFEKIVGKSTATIEEMKITSSKKADEESKAKIAPKGKSAKVSTA